MINNYSNPYSSRGRQYKKEYPIPIPMEVHFDSNDDVDLFLGKKKIYGGGPDEYIAPAIAAAAPALIKKVGPIVGKLFSKIGIKKDDDVINLRHGFFMLFEKNGVFVDKPNGGWEPLVVKHKIKHKDIPNKKLLGNYKDETQRVIEWAVDMFNTFYPGAAQAFVDFMDAGVAPHDAGARALAGQQPSGYIDQSVLTASTAPQTTTTSFIPGSTTGGGAPPAEEDKTKKMLIIGGSVLGGLLLILVAVMAIKRKKG